MKAIPALYFSGKLLSLSLRDIVKNLVFPVIGASLMAAILLFIQYELLGMGDAIHSLLILVTFGVAIYAIASACFLRPQLGQLRLFLNP